MFARPFEGDTPYPGWFPPRDPGYRRTGTKIKTTQHSKPSSENEETSNNKKSEEQSSANDNPQPPREKATEKQTPRVRANNPGVSFGHGYHPTYGAWSGYQPFYYPPPPGPYSHPWYPPAPSTGWPRDTETSTARGHAYRHPNGGVHFYQGTFNRSLEQAKKWGLKFGGKPTEDRAKVMAELLHDEALL
uniref:Uncharacterized protein n=1 Tax=Bracon brevicornis TaxID=1563983 RepID=A0A6V7KQ32_9HYME